MRMAKNSPYRTPGARIRIPQPESPIEAKLAIDMRALKLPAWERNYVFLEDRSLELDFAWPAWKFGVEVDGAVHRIKDVFHRDREKQALALLARWSILRVTGLHVRDGRAVAWIEQLLSRYAHA